MNDYVMHLVFPFIIFIRMHLVSHLGTLAEAREGHDVKPNPKMELVDPSRRSKDRTSGRLEDACQAGFI
jgi:hypothetical protein